MSEALGRATALGLLTGSLAAGGLAEVSESSGLKFCGSWSLSLMVPWRKEPNLVKVFCWWS